MKARKLLIVVFVSILLGLTACGSLSGETSTFDLEQMIIDVFDPQPGEKVLIMVDRPPFLTSDKEAWFHRREMAKEWHQVFQKMSEEGGFSVYPMFTYLATEAHNAPLPVRGSLGKKVMAISEIMSDTNIVVAMTQFSATAPLLEYTQKYPDLRVASMPMVSKSMQDTALAADYSEVARKAQILAEKLSRAEGARVEFSTGHTMFLDLRNRSAEVDDGKLHADKEEIRVINLPSGESYIVPYEGELAGQPSRTEGMIPMLEGGELIVLNVEENRVTKVYGRGPVAAELRGWFALDPARRNVAELGLGCNDRAVVTGNVIEYEKAMGMHLAGGRSDHIGGTIGVEDFTDPVNVVHKDIVYPNGGDIEIAKLVLDYEDGSSEEIIRNGEYAIFTPKKQVTAAQLYTGWLFLVAGSLIYLAWDLERGQRVPGRMKLCWALSTLIFGPFGLGGYLLSCSQNIRSTQRDTNPWRVALVGTLSKAAMGCVWMVVLLLYLINFVPETGPVHVLGLAFLLPFLVSLFGIAAPITSRQLNIGYWVSVYRTVLNEFISMTLIFVGMFPTIFFLESTWFPESTSAAEPLFWVMISLAGAAGALVYYPYEYWAARGGLFRWSAWMAAEDGSAQEGVELPKLRYAWGALLVSVALFLGSLGLMAVGMQQ